MQIEIQLDEERARKLAYLQQATRQDATEVLQQALDQSYDQLQLAHQTAQSAYKTPLEIFQESGFIGSIEADSDISANYKPILREMIQKKFDRSHET
jgi:predicted nucleic acid-binding protein